MESHLPAFKEVNPQLEVDTEMIRGQHPHLKAFYSKILGVTRNFVTKIFYFFCNCKLMILLWKTENHNDRVVCVKNMDPEEILLHATRLRNALGRKVIKLRTRHVTKHPSVQGTWTTALKY